MPTPRENKATQAKPVEELPSVRQSARDAWEKHAGNQLAATEALYKIISKDTKLLEKILPQILRLWCAGAIHSYLSELRFAAIQPSDTTQRGARLREVLAATLFDFPLPGGKRLGDANAAELRAAAERYMTQANDMGHKGRWLRAVAGKVGQHNRAEGAMTLKQLEELLESARHAEA
jgi:hypothetical protein